MIINRYEHTQIANSELPNSWKERKSILDLADFLQNNWEERYIFYDDGNVNSKQKFLTFLANDNLKTNNYIGTIMFKGEQLNIYPKVFKEHKNDNKIDELNENHLMSNIIQWLEYCNKMQYPLINISSDLSQSKNLMDLFITLYISYVSAAIERGIYFQYVEETNDINVIKGRLNITDYLSNKIPNGKYDKFECTYSTFEFDNKVNRIIKYTCTQLLKLVSGRNQKKLRNILNRLNDVTLVPCTPTDCDSIRLSKMHNRYSIILNLSKMMLMNKVSNFNMSINESFCFLFPTEILFEGFIGGFIKETVDNYGGNVKLQQSDMSLIDEIIYGEKNLGPAFRMRHDVVVNYEDKIFILDTKYKEISRFEGNLENVESVVKNEPKQTDLYQMLEYARKRNVKDVYLLYPMYRYEVEEPIFPCGISNSESISINIHFIRIPFVFNDNIDEIKCHLTKTIKKMFNITDE